MAGRRILPVTSAAVLCSTPTAPAGELYGHTSFAHARQIVPAPVLSHVAWLRCACRDNRSSAAAVGTGDSFGGKGLMAQLETGTALTTVPDDAEKRAAGQLVDASYKLTHTEGFEAWLRNRKGSDQVVAN